MELVRGGLDDLPMKVIRLSSCQVSLGSFHVFTEGSFRLPTVSDQVQATLPRLYSSPRSFLSETMVETVPVYQLV